MENKMEDLCAYNIVVRVNEAVLKRINKLSKKLNTTNTKLLTSILSHGINALSDCLDTKDPFKNLNPVYAADIQRQKPLAPRVTPKNDSEESVSTEATGLEDFKF